MQPPIFVLKPSSLVNPPMSEHVSHVPPTSEAISDLISYHIEIHQMEPDWEKKKKEKKRPRMHMCRIPSPKNLTPLRNHNHAKKPKTSLPPPKDHTNPRTLATPHSISSFGLLELFSTLLDPPTPAPTPIGVPTPAAPLKTLHTTSTAPRISSPQGPSNWNERNARRAFSMRAFPRGRRMYW